jgi:hypothetical protein
VVGACTSAVSDGDGRNDDSEAVNGESETDDGDSEAGDDDKKETFKEDLKSWMIAADAQGLPRKMQDDLLNILRARGLTELPKDSRTLTKRPKHVNVVNNFVYFGLAKTLQSINGLPDNDLLELQIGIDGIPVHKDGKKQQMWPILVSTIEITPMIVAIWYGDNKPPSVSQYMQEFMVELDTLIREGLVIHGKRYHVSLMCFICDAPARSFLKQIKAHNALESCERCNIKGKKVNKVTCYIGCGNERKRTDDGYKNSEYIPNHQCKNAPSPLLDYDVGLVSQFPLDYMHLVCLGVVRRFLNYLTTTNTEYRITVAKYNQMGDRLKSFAAYMPSEFSRRPRHLLYIDRFKATEFRQFLLYSGIAALRNIVETHVYRTFLCLTTAFIVLLNDDLRVRHRFLNYARESLYHFVRNSAKIFGNEFVTYNVHGLLHIADDCEEFHCNLNLISAFQFESFLCRLKNRVKSCKNALVQVSKSILMERDHKQNKNTNCEHQLVSRISAHRLVLSSKTRDRYLFDTSQRLCVIKEVYDKGNAFLCDIVDRQCLSNLFDVPRPSSDFMIYRISKFTSHHNRMLTVKDVWRKAIILPLEKGDFVAMPLLHSVGCQ